MADDETRSVKRLKGGGRKTRRFASFEEEMEAIQENPAAKELLDLLKDQAPERTGQLVSKLATMTEDEAKEGGESNEREDGKEAD